MIAYLIVEGKFDEALLHQIVPAEFRDGVRFVSERSSSDVVSTARTLLVQRQKPLAIVMAAGSVVPDVIQERRQSMEEVIGIVAGRVPFKVVVAIPALEVIFFHDACLLERLLGEPAPAEMRTLARFDPGGVLDQLCDRSAKVKDRGELLQALTETDLTLLRSAPVAQELLAFLQQARAWADVHLAVSPT
jgi:hypothetical protein